MEAPLNNKKKRVNLGSVDEFKEIMKDYITRVKQIKPKDRTDADKEIVHKVKTFQSRVAYAKMMAKDEYKKTYEERKEKQREQYKKKRDTILPRQKEYQRKKAKAKRPDSYYQTKIENAMKLLQENCSLL